MSFKDIIQPLIERGVPVIPLRPRTKIAFSPDWPTLATTDSAQILRWDTEFPNANCAAVAKAESNGTWILEIDDPAMWSRIQKETGQKFPQTFIVRSRPGRGHLYWRHNNASIELAAAKSYYSLKDVNGKEQCSARLNHAYVVGPGSVHPETQVVYEVRSAAPITEAPQWLIDWIKKNLTENAKLPLTARSDGPKIPRGSHDNELTRIAGKLRQDGMEESTLADALIEICEKRCEDYGSDYREMCAKIAHSIGRKPIVDTRVLHNGIPVGSDVSLSSQTTVQIPSGQISGSDFTTEPEVDDAEVAFRPAFPKWVMNETSLYENLVKPAAAASDKYEELIWMPAVLMFLNTIAGRVKLKSQQARMPNLFLGVIAPYGHFYKSSSCELAQNYFIQMGKALKDAKMAGDKTIILSPGSPEGLGLRLKDCHATHAVLYYDELGKFVAKGRIEHSSFVEDICSIYDSRDFANEIKSNKDSFRFSAGTYCFSWLWCTTDRKFPQLWANLSNEDSGLNDRMFFLLSPEEERESGLYSEPVLDSESTRKMIETAMTQHDGIFDYEDYTDAQGKARGIDPRSLAMFENFSLYFAVDLGRDAIDADCCERARALVEYRNRTQKFLDPIQAETSQGKDQMGIVHELRRNHGKMITRDLKKAMRSDRLGSDRWYRAYHGLILEKVIDERAAIGAMPGRKPEDQRPAMTYLLKQEG